MMVEMGMGMYAATIISGAVYSVFLILCAAIVACSPRPHAAANIHNNNNKNNNDRYSHSSMHQRDKVCRTPFEFTKSPADCRNADVVVVGSGPAGLATGASLALAGQRVVVLEQNEQAGGGMHEFDSFGVTHDSGIIHYVGYDPALFDMLDRLCADPIEWCRQASPEHGDVCDRVQIGARTYSLPTGGWDAYCEYLCAQFPKQQAEIQLYTKRAAACATNPQVKKFVRLKALRVPLWLRQCLQRWACSSFLADAGRTTARVLEEECGIAVPSELAAVICSRFGNHGLPPRKSSFFMHCVISNQYVRGGNYPKGGPSEIARQLAATIVKCGGQVLTKARVDRVKIANGKVQAIVVNSNYIPCNRVVLATGPNQMLEMVRGSDFATRMQLDLLQYQVRPSVAYSFAFCGFKTTTLASDNSRDIKEDTDKNALRLPSFNLWYYPHYDFDTLVDDFRRNPNEAPMSCFVASGSAKDASWATRHPTKASMVVIGPAPPYDVFTPFEGLTHEEREANEEYQAIKRRITSRLMDSAGVDSFLEQGEQFPKDNDAATTVTTIKVEGATPLTTNQFLGVDRGQVYGIEWATNHWQCPALMPDTSVKGLFRTGAHNVVCGLSGGVMSGVLTANVVCGTGMDMLTGRSLFNDE